MEQRKKLAAAAGFIKTLSPFLNSLPGKKNLAVHEVRWPRE